MIVCNVLLAGAVLLSWLEPEPTDSRAHAPDLILHNGRIVTVDRDFSIHEALAVRGDRIVRVGRNDDVLQSKGRATVVVDLGGKIVIPGLIDSHVHATDACMTEFDHPVPEMEAIGDVLAYVRSRADALGAGAWIQVRQVFITRLKEQRYPTREELDRAAPNNPVVFSTGPDASLNSLALRLSGIDRDFRVNDGGPGYIEREPTTGEPTGILRGCTRYVKYQSAARQPTDDDKDRRLAELLADYNSVGITAIVERDADPPGIEQYRRLRARGKLSTRVAISHGIDTLKPLDEIQQQIRRVATDPLHKLKGGVGGDARLRIIGIKTYLDGGMLTGSAYMREPWGVSKIYAIADPNYRGVLNIPKERLLPIVRTTVEAGLQFTAHSVGDGAVHTLLDVYDEINRTLPIRATRPCITHSNFMSKDAVDRAAKLGVIVDIQPAWLYLDTRTLVAQFGYERLQYFQPLRSIFEEGGVAGGGSDHMQKIGSLRSVNPYNPFLGMWITVTRQARWYDGQLHPEQALTREQALRFYTINNAYLMFMDDSIGSLEPGKRADFVVLDRDILSCAADDIKDTQVLRTYIDGKLIYERHAAE